MALKNKKKKVTLEDILETMNLGFSATSKAFTNIEERMATKDDLKGFATKKDLEALETRLANKIDNVQESVNDVERKLVEDTGLIASVEHKRDDSLIHRVSRLEKKVFPTTT